MFILFYKNTYFLKILPFNLRKPMVKRTKVLLRPLLYITPLFNTITRIKYKPLFVVKEGS